MSVDAQSRLIYPWFISRSLVYLPLLGLSPVPWFIPRDVLGPATFTLWIVRSRSKIPPSSFSVYSRMKSAPRDHPRHVSLLQRLWTRTKRALGILHRETLSNARPSDTWVVSYPKSGNTWVRFLLTHLLSGGAPLSWEGIDQHVPDIHQGRERIDRMSGKRFIKSHKPLFEEYPNSIYLCRDGRDVMVSYYHFLKGYGEDVGSFSEFLQDYPKWPGTWSNHVIQALQARNRDPERVLIVRFEDLKNDPEHELARMADYAGIEATDYELSQAVEACHISNLKALEENDRPSTRKEATNKFFRSGKTKQWKSVFSENDLKYFYSKSGEALSRLGYMP